MWLFCVTAALPKDLGHDQQIPFPHFSDLNILFDFNTTYCVIIFVGFGLEMMMSWRWWCEGEVHHIIWKAGEQCSDISTATMMLLHWTLVNTTPEAESSWSQLFAAMNANLGQQSLLGNLIIPDTARGKVLCCACNHPTALSWVMRSSTNYWTVSRLELTKLAWVLNPLLKP